MMRPSGYTDGWQTPGIDPAHALCVLEPDAPRWRFLGARRTGVGGSDVSGILGLSKWNSPLDVWADKVDPDRPDQDNEPMFWGRELEPVLRRVFEQRTDLTVTVPGTLRSVPHPYMMCNLDGLVSDGDILEIKTCRDYASAQWEDDQVADHAELQAQHNMAVSGAPGCWVVCLIGGQEMVVRHVDRDEQIIADLIKVETEFWENYVLTGEMPPPEPSEAYTDALSERFRLATEGIRTIETETRSRLRAMLDQADAAATYAEAEDTAKNWMRKLLAEQTDLRHGETVLATWKQNGNFSKKKFKQDHPELWEEHQVKVEEFDLDWLKEHRPDLYTEYRGRTLRVKDF